MLRVLDQQKLRFLPRQESDPAGRLLEHSHLEALGDVFPMEFPRPPITRRRVPDERMGVEVLYSLLTVAVPSRK